MKKFMIGFISILIMIVCILIYIINYGTYKGIQPGHIDLKYSMNSNVQTSSVINCAKELKGIFYDQLQGRFNNIGGKTGFLVCIDVPNIAYSKSGYPLEYFMKLDYNKYSNSYKIKGLINNPENEFFYRRVRNLYTYCKNNNLLINHCNSPKVGDLVFYYNNTHIAVISEIFKDGFVNEIETYPLSIVVIESKKKWADKTIGRLIK